MLALTQLKPGDIIPGMFDLDIDGETYWDEGIFQIEVYPLVRDDEPGYYRTDGHSYTIIDATAPHGHRCQEQYEQRIWAGATATELRVEHNELLALVPEWARCAFRGAMEDAASQQMRHLKMGINK